MSELAIETIELSRRFGEIKAVNDLNLHVPKGSIYGFLGPNGSGKTTTIRLLLGLLKPNKGNTTIFGLQLQYHKLEILKKIGAMIELPSLYSHLTGWENLEVTRRLINGDKGKISQVLEIVGLTNHANRLVKGYSQGMRQRLGLALALLNDPEILILDEPTNGLDPSGIHEIRNLICALPQKYGITVFLSSHLLSEIEQMATVVGIINSGKLLFEGSVQDLKSQRKGKIVIETNNLEKAKEVLENSGWAPFITKQGLLEIINDSKENTAKINNILIQNKVDVYSLNYIRPSLEEMFLEITKSNNSEVNT